MGAETERLRRAERPAERGRLRRGCFGMAAAKAGAGSCDADASEWQQPQTDAGSCLRVLHIVANERCMCLSVQGRMCNVLQIHIDQFL